MAIKMLMNGIGNCKDITGLRSGKLEAIKYYGRNKHNQALWICKCDCGNNKIVRACDLVSNNIKSCGCLSSKNLVGKRFGKLVVVEFSGVEHYKKIWKCQCDCGNITYVNTNYLVSGHTTSCGCNKEKHLDGKKFNKLLVIKEHHRDNKGKYYLCKCDCGNYTVVRSDCLLSGNVVSCGCALIKPKIDVKGKIFGKLTVVDYDGYSYWTCKCDCGNFVRATTSQLIYGYKTSCGCDSDNIAHSGSSVENYIKNYVTSLLPNEPVEKARILDGKEIDIYFPNLKFGIEYNGSAFHASESGVYKNLDKYYHRNKFLLARNKGIKLISIFDKYFEYYDEIQLNIIKDVINDVHPFIPMNEIEYTNNNYDYGLWMKNFGYTEVGQEEPREYNYGDFKVYDCGRTIWRKECY